MTAPATSRADAVVMVLLDRPDIGLARIRTDLRARRRDESALLRIAAGNHVHVIHRPYGIEVRIGAVVVFRQKRQERRNEMFGVLAAVHVGPVVAWIGETEHVLQRANERD